VKVRSSSSFSRPLFQFTHPRWRWKKKKKVFIAEITARAFIVADSNKRRTLSRADIAKALSKSDQFDFLIDVVPRDEPFVPGVSGPGKNSKKTISGSASTKRDPVRVVDASSSREQ
jgi:nuclear transcription factor Y, gamma